MVLEILGLKEHNLKNIDVKIKRNALTVLTGVSGSGKSTLAIDTIAAEGQRQYIESLSTYARQYLSKMKRPDADKIAGISPTIIIDQKPLGRNPRSTVGTVTEIYTLLRLLYSRIGSPSLTAGHFSFNRPIGACEMCKGLGSEFTINPDDIIDWDKSLSAGAILHSLFKPSSRYFNILKATNRVDMDKPIKDYTETELEFLLFSEKISFKNESQGFIQSYSHQGVIPRLISRNKDLRGLSKPSKKKDSQFLSTKECSYCSGSRLKEAARSVSVDGKNIPDIVDMQVTELYQHIQTITSDRVRNIVRLIEQMLENIIDLQIGYLTLNRSVDTLSSGEAQRIKLARQMGSSLSKVIYVLDEPTIGLHSRDVNKLIKILHELKAKDNTVIVVEHDLEIIRNADEIIDMGPKAGIYGGEIVAQGTVNDIKKCEYSITGAYLRGDKEIFKRSKHRKPMEFIKIANANKNNLKNINIDIPLGVFCCITGVSGSGKSTLVNEYITKKVPNAIIIDQTPIGRSSRSIPATYVGAFDLIRKKLAIETNQDPGLFSFNGDGKCEVCNGLGYETIDMHFLAEVNMICEECHGKRYCEGALKHLFKGKNIFDILEMSISESLEFFDDKNILNKLRMLDDVGLGYIKLGQPTNTLSGGEAQRVKLADKLNLKGDVYILDEPTSGLHVDDINQLLGILSRIVDNHNTVIVVEHHLDVIKNADWIIDLGPDGGDAGGEVIATGSPIDLSHSSISYTGQCLKKLI